MSARDHRDAARRDTPLAAKLKARIARRGPITVAQYMQACLQDPERGYYRTRDPIGRSGDFITAPEISQVFGELLGLWCAVVWQQMGAPDRLNLIELGPGRGTLMRDALRATQIVPGFAAAVRLHLVESNTALRRQQADLLAPLGKSPTWHAHATELPQGPSIVLANEFLDVLPVTQHIKSPPGWVERGVGLDSGGQLAFTVLAGRPRLFPFPIPEATPDGAILERAPDTLGIAYALSRLAAGGPLAALFVDYGHFGPHTGETLQAVRLHRYEHPLTSPGEADLTAHVDFAALAEATRGWQLACDGPVTQSELLGSLGIIERASRLMAANPARAGEIEAGVARLLSPGGMGTRFKAIGIRTPLLPPLPGFPPVDKSGCRP